MERKITKIDSLSPFRGSSATSLKMRRVAAYVRVSTDKEEQQNSFMNQKDYFPKLIAERPNWEFMGLYSDEGLSATTISKREGFNKLIADGLAGEFDLIVTKSISRFARNTVDTLKTIRKLEAAGVEVYFEKEDLFSFDGKGEFMLTLLSSLAQEESRSLSENTTWGIRRNMAKGKYSMPYAQFLGYEKGVDGKPAVVKAEAAIARRIFRMFLQRYSVGHITKSLSDEGVPSPSGKPQWRPGTVYNILHNEKYVGNALLQKCFTEDFITKKRTPNRGELPKYIVENGHPPIVSSIVFEETQKRLSEISEIRMNQETGFLSNMVFCGKCGNRFGRKIVHNYARERCGKYKHVIWRCAQTYERDKSCRAPYLYEEVAAFVFNQVIQHLLSENSDILEICRKLINSVVRDKKRQEEIEQALTGFAARSPSELSFDVDAWRTIVERASVLADWQLGIQLIDGTKMEYPMPKYSKHKNKLIAGSILEESLKELASNR